MPKPEDGSSISTPEPSPLLLLAEDDTTSRRFLIEALGELGYDVEACSDGARALALAQAHRFDLLLLDHRMPHAGAEEILRQLRNSPHAQSHATPAIATSADVSPKLRQHLLDQGFEDVLAKPVDLHTLDDALGAVLPHRHPSVVLHDEMALARSGNMETMEALRALFVTELQRLLVELPQLSEHPRQFADRLHQLRAACGFCGAEALAQHTIRLRRRLDRGIPPGTDAVNQFERTVQATLDALGQRD